MIRVVGGLLVGTALAWAQRPSDLDAAATIEKSRDKALAYTRSLPDFMCSEVVQRYHQAVQTYTASTGSSRGGGTAEPWIATEAKWIPIDKLTVRLSFFQQKEDHKLMLVNDRPADRSYEDLKGGIAVGEFGATLDSIFSADSGTTFHWESWKNVQKHRTAVYAYVVDAAHSHYAVMNGAPGSTHQAIVGFHGNVDVDSVTGEVLHFTYVADRIPKDVKLDRVSTTVDYDFVDVGGRDYLLPAHSETEIRSPRLSVRNVMEFRDYRKFSADSMIEFGIGK
jgi:hypothetical protein